MIDFPGEGSWLVPEGWILHPSERPARCRSCGAHVLWLVSRRGKRAPFNHDGVSHFATCPEASTWRRK